MTGQQQLTTADLKSLWELCVICSRAHCRIAPNNPDLQNGTAREQSSSDLSEWHCAQSNLLPVLMTAQVPLQPHPHCIKKIRLLDILLVTTHLTCLLSN